MAGMQMVQYPEGSIILKEGEDSEELFKIVKGHVEIYVGYGTKQETLLKILGEQSCFGEFGLLLHKPSIYTVVAYSDVLALKISEDAMDEFIRSNRQSVMNIMRNMANTMITLKTQIDLLLNDLENGKKTDDKVMLNARKIMRGYGMCGMFRSIEEAVDGMKSKD